MRTTSLQKFVRLHRELVAERETLQSRLRDINEALGEMPLPSLSPIQGAASSSPSPARRGRRAAGGGQSLREHVIAVLQSGPKTKEDVLAAVQQRGYRFSTKNPLNSLGVILYGRNPKFNRVDGRFSMGRGSGLAARSAGPVGTGPRPKRRMSPAARKAIAEAARKRWAAAKAAGRRRL